MAATQNGQKPNKDNVPALFIAAGLPSQKPTMSLPTLVELQSFFDTQNQSPDTALQWPKLLNCQNIDGDEHKVQLALKIKPELDYFDGHFPGQPVLPGVVQIHWAGECSKRLFNLTGFHTLQGAKFNSMVLPNTEILLDLHLKPEKHSVRFSFHRADEKFSLGSLLFKTLA